MGGEKEKVKEWYDGFVFGTYKDIYNPWSILNFLDTGEYTTYWANTSSNSLVGKLIREGSSQVKTGFETLLRGESIICPIDEQIVYNQLNGSKAAVWSLLVASGYLKILAYEDMGKVRRRANYELTITNGEVRIMFESMVQSWFEESEEEYNHFLKALLLGDLKAMNHYMQRLTITMFSYFDTGKGKFGDEPERLHSVKAITSSFKEQNSCACFYHGFILGLLVDLGRDYIVTSNRESGFGRYDVMIEPRDKTKEAFVLEFKVHDPIDEKSLSETVEKALAQIEEKQYETELIARGIAKEKIRKYGFAFEGKKVLIGV